VHLARVDRDHHLRRKSGEKKGDPARGFSGGQEFGGKEGDHTGKKGEGPQILLVVSARVGQGEGLEGGESTQQLFPTVMCLDSKNPWRGKLRKEFEKREKGGKGVRVLEARSRESRGIRGQKRGGGSFRIRGPHCLFGRIVTERRRGGRS